MSTRPTTAAQATGDRPRSGTWGGCAAALIEVSLAFALAHLSYRSFKHFTELGRQEGAAGLNFSPGTVMTLFTVAALLLGRRNFAEYGLTLKDWRYNLNVGLFWSVLLTAAAGLLILLIPVRFDPLHAPDLRRALVFSLGEVVATVLLMAFLLREMSAVRRVPASISLFVLGGLLCLPLVVAVIWQRPVLNVLLTVFWLFFGAGFGEEIFFRGYIQSRVNEAFGRPFRVLGLQFGPGLVVSALLFGFIHVLNTVDYFQGQFDFAWLWWVTNFCAGLFLGCLRERSASILPGAVVHGLEDVLGSVPGLLP